jgi:hypothetical protein
MVSTVLATFQSLHALFSHQLLSTTRRAFVLVQDVRIPIVEEIPDGNDLRLLHHFDHGVNDREVVAAITIDQWSRNPFPCHINP